MMRLKDIEHAHYDVCVCGSGPSGSIIAVELARKGLKTVLLEVGDRQGGSSLDSIAGKTQIYGEKSPLYNFARELGGSSNLWSGRTSFFEKVDFALNEWPLNFEDMAQDVAKAEEILGVSKVDLPKEHKKLTDGVLGILAQAPFDLKPFVMQHHFKPFNTRDYLQENANDDLDIVLDAYVLRVDEGDEGKIHSVRAKCLSTKQEHLVNAEVFVLATGGLDVPRILLRSSLKSLEQCDAVGRYFSTHPKLFIGHLTLDKRIRGKNGLLSDQFEDGQYVRLGLGFDEAFILRHGLLNHYIQVSPKLESFSLDLMDRIRDNNRLIAYLYNRGGLTRRFVNALGKFVFTASQRLASKFGFYSNFSLKLHCDQFPRAENKVALSSELDALGEPKIDIDWEFSSEDLENARTFLLCLKQEIEENRIGRISLNEQVFQDDWPLIGVHSHFLGTTRMGKNAAVSVTDGFGKVHGCDNLYISGPSLFPGYGYTNPFLPIVAFALRTAKEIADSHQGEPPAET